MKTALATICFVAVCVVLAMPNRSFAQTASDTMVVAAMPPGNLNNVIMGDTTSTGQRADPNRVYVLAPDGPVDTTYFFTVTMYVKYNLTIIGKTNPNTGHPPVIEPFINADNSSPNPVFQVTSGSATLKNLFFLGYRTDGIHTINSVVRVNGDSVRIDMDRCVVDGYLGYAFTIVASYANVFVSNSEFRDISWAGALIVSVATPADTLEFVNNTFYDVKIVDYQAQGYVGYLKFDHNTSFMGSFNTFVGVQMTNAYIENNIFYGLCASGADSLQIAGSLISHSNNQFGYRIFGLDTLTTVANGPYNFTEAERNVVLKNNAYCWPKAFYDFWTAFKDTTTIPAMNTLQPPLFMDPRTVQMFSDHTTWPGLVAANNDSVDPGFSPSIVTPSVDSLLKFTMLLYETGTNGTFVQIPYVTSPLNIFGGVAPDWAQKQGYPVPENLAYSNPSLQTAGTDGFALGDLNWYPAQLKLFEEGKVNAVSSQKPDVPSSFSLSQNYPNPFNPTTDIKVSLNHAGVMSLTIYNVLGQVVDVVDQGYKPAGEYTYNVNMDNFASGVYFYTLREGSNFIAKKMVLLK